jgi:polysaccharide biosynthesis/export protein
MFNAIESKRKLIKGLSLLLLGSLLVACASPRVKSNKFEQSLSGKHWFEQVAHQQDSHLTLLTPRQPYLSNFAPIYKNNEMQNSKMIPNIPLLSPGDRVRLWMPSNVLFSGVFNENDREFNHFFEINMDGKIKLPYLKPIEAEGLSLDDLEANINNALVSQGLLRKDMAHVSAAIAEWAPITVFVSGAVFVPGQVSINVRKPDSLKLLRDNSSGDLPLGRMIASALRSAGGVRPDADVSNIEVVRRGKSYRVDMRGAILGYPTGMTPLMHGDMIRVSSVGTPQVELIKPSAITPPGIRVFISNLTVPALNNASSAVNKHSSSLPYGSRLLTAVVSGNCAGGTFMTNSGRIAVLVTQDPVSQSPIAIERDIESLLRAPNRVDLNPYLMPNDSIVCYDSEVTNFRDIASTISSILFPASWLLGRAN